MRHADRYARTLVAGRSQITQRGSTAVMKFCFFKISGAFRWELWRLLFDSDHFRFCDACHGRFTARAVHVPVGASALSRFSV
jgi:hypothetical protein